jgi:hypothetical protein
MACAGQIDDNGQAGGYISRTTNVPKSLSDFSRPWNKDTPKTQPARKKNPTQNLAKQLQTGQELTNNRTSQKHTDQATHLKQICHMDLPGPTTSVGTRTDYSVGPWDYSSCATRHLMEWGARTTVEEYSNRKLYMSCTV